jgi:hypothetical protein
MTFRDWLHKRGKRLEDLSQEQRTAFAEEWLEEVRSEMSLEVGVTSPDDRGSCTRAAVFAPSSVNEEDRTVRAILSTESRVPMLDYRNWEIIEEVLRTDGVVVPANGQMPMLDTHNRWTVEAQFGSIRDLGPDGADFAGTLHFARDQRSEDSFGKVRDGHVTDMSVGYHVFEHEDIPPKQSRTVKGRSYTAGERTLRISTKWGPFEASLCPVGQDRSAKIRSAGIPTGSAHRSRTNGEEVAVFEWLMKQRGISKEQFEAMSEEEQAKLRAAFEASQQRSASGGADPVNPPAASNPPAPADPARTPEEVAAEAVRMERERVSQIRTLGDIDGLDPDVVESAINDGRTVDQARAAILDAVRTMRAPSVGAPSIHVRDHDSAATLDNLQAGLELRANVDVGQQQGDRYTIGAERAERGHDFREYSLLDFCREALRLEGIRIPRSRQEQIRAGVSTMTLPKIFENVATKIMLTGYRQAPNTSLRWCSTKEVPDFKEFTMARLGDSSDFQEVGPGGEIKDGEFSEWAEKSKLKTYARSFSVTRQDMINDDMGALIDIPLKMGAAGARLIDDVVYAVLLANAALNDGIALFEAANHANYVASGAALADTTLSAGRAAMRKQTDLGGSPLNIEPTFLLVPPDLEDTALRLVRSAEVMKVGDDESLHGTYNPNRNRFEVLAEPRLSNTTFNSNADDDAWYLAASAAQVGTMTIAFLTGGREPTIEQTVMDRNILGMSWRGFFDVAAKAEDFRGLYKAKED